MRKGKLRQAYTTGFSATISAAENKLGTTGEEFLEAIYIPLEGLGV